ncbi:hypothetical protein [Amnibacterium sp.]|uniref:hypothetical protein n=1 Tax=Amnibacterium sp. TaxID=1872496 RepID=UPI00345DDEB7
MSSVIAAEASPSNELVASLADAFDREGVDEERRDGHAPRLVHLRRADEDPSGHFDGVLLDSSAAPREVQVPHPEPSRLAPPRARVGEELHECAVRLGEGDEKFDLFHGQVGASPSSLAGQEHTADLYC